jgi:hypothetical protein
MHIGKIGNRKADIYVRNQLMPNLKIARGASQIGVQMGVIVTGGSFA